MENQEYHEHILERIQKIEQKLFGGTYEENYSPSVEEEPEDEEE